MSRDDRINSTDAPDALDAAIQAGLRRKFAPGQPDGLVAAVVAASAAAASSAAADSSGIAAPAAATSWLRAPRFRMAAAACIAIGGLTAAFFVARDTFSPPDPYGGKNSQGYAGGYSHDRPKQSMDEAYFAAVANDMRPDWVCGNDAEFVATFERQVGQPMLLGALPAGVEMTGLSYGNVVSPSTVLILGRADAQPIVVFVDRTEAAPPIAPLQAKGLHLHRSKLGSAFLYELSPFSTPRLIPHLVAAPPSPSACGATDSFGFGAFPAIVAR